MRIALYQCPPLPLDVAGNLQRLAEQARIAAAQGVQLLVCPEMFLTGYNIGADAVSRLAEPATGAAAQRIAEMACATGVAILYGYPERDGDAVYNAAQLIDHTGQRLCNYRKTHLYGELDRAMFSAGDALAPLLNYRGWSLGILICYDVEFPELPRRLALEGADAILVPTANMQPYTFIGEITVRSRAFESQCYLAYTNYCGQEGEILYCGQSSLNGPDGLRLAEAGHAETLLIADLDRGTLASARNSLPYLLDRRPELYR